MMRHFFVTLFLVAVWSAPAYADSYGTTPTLTLPELGASGWGTTTRNAFKDLTDFNATFANSDGTLKATTTATPWQQVTGPVTWLSAASFKVPETLLFDDIPGRKVSVVQATDAVCSVASVVTAVGETTVTVTGCVEYADNATSTTVTDPITSVSVSIVTPRSDVAPPTVPSAITDLADTPSSLTANTQLQVNAAGTALAAFDATPFHFYNSTPQSIPDSTWTYLNFDVSSISNPNATVGTGAYFTVPETGVYVFFGAYSLTVTPNEEHLWVGISINGGHPYCAIATNASYGASSGNQYLTSAMSCLYAMSAGTVVRLVGYQDTGAARTTITGSSYTWFQGYRIR